MFQALFFLLNYVSSVLEYEKVVVEKSERERERERESERERKREKEKE